MQEFIDRHGGKLLVIIILIGLLPITGGCAARQIKPITAESKLDSAAIAASIPSVYDTVRIKMVMIGDSVASKEIELRPRSVLDVVATRDTSGTIKLVNGDTVFKELKFSSSNSTVAATDERIKTHEITTRGKSDRTDSKNRWPCMIACGGVTAGVAGGYSSYDAYGYSSYSMRSTPLPAGCNQLMPGGCVTGFGHFGATGQNVIATPNGVFPIRR